MVKEDGYVIAVLARDKQCFYCSTPFIEKVGDKEVVDVEAMATATGDHLWPNSMQGSNMPENLVAACHRCNAARGTFVPKFYQSEFEVLRAALTAYQKERKRLRGIHGNATKKYLSAVAALRDPFEESPTWLVRDDYDRWMIAATALPHYLERLWKETKPELGEKVKERNAAIQRILDAQGAKTPDAFSRHFDNLAAKIGGTYTDEFKEELVIPSKVPPAQ